MNLIKFKSNLFEYLLYFSWFDIDFLGVSFWYSNYLQYLFVVKSYNTNFTRIIEKCEVDGVNYVSPSLFNMLHFLFKNV
jgi:hypothetical protein